MLIEALGTNNLGFYFFSVAPYERKGRRDKNSDGSDKPRVPVSAFFRKVISLRDYRELYGIDEALKTAEHNVHTYESE